MTIHPVRMQTRMDGLPTSMLLASSYPLSINEDVRRNGAVWTYPVDLIQLRRGLVKILP